LYLFTSAAPKRKRIVYDGAPLVDYMDLMVTLANLLYLFTMVIITDLTRLVQLSRKNITREPRELPINARELRHM
jgi:hypothetical protein